MKINDSVKVLVARSCLPLCDPMDCGPPDFSVHEILQERLLEWIVIPFFPTQEWILGFQHCRGLLTVKERSVKDNRVEIFQLLLRTIFVS